MSSAARAFGTLMGAALLTSFAMPASAADKASWNFSVWGSPRAVTKSIERVSEAVAERTGGNFELKIHYGDAVSPARENLDNIKIGAIEGALICTSYHPGKTPLSGVLDLPFLPIPDLDSLAEVQTAVANHPAIRQEFERWGAVVYLPNPLPLYEFMGVGNPPRKLEDWKNMRVRALGGQGDAMRLLGAVPTSMPSNETYTSLERGVVQGVALPFTYAFYSFRLHEISRWFTLGMQPGSAYCPMVLSQAALEQLPAEWRVMLDDLKDDGYEALKAAYISDDEKFLPLFKERLEVITYDDEAMARLRAEGGEPVWKAWAEEQDRKGLAGTEVLEFTMEQARKVAAPRS